MNRAVVDTNVLVSALLSPRGNEALTVLAISQKFLRACFSEPILLEYKEVLARPKFSFPAEQIEALIALLRENGDLIAPAAASHTLADASDQKFLDCAQSALADFIITGNKRHFPRELCAGVLVVNCAELLDFITLNDG